MTLLDIAVRVFWLALFLAALTWALDLFPRRRR